MQPRQSQVLCEPLLAAMPQLKEKQCLGVPSSDPAPYPGHEVPNSTVAIGFRAALHLDAVRSRYTGKERDQESGNDYFGARYYGSSMGRFLSPDISSDPDALEYSTLSDPQSLNLYSYVGNNPLGRTDADGHSVQICTTDSSGSQKCNTVDNPTYDKAASGNNGGLNVPSEQSVERTGSGNITDSNGNVVGTVKYVVDGGLDGPANLAGANMIGNGGMGMVNMFMRNMGYTVAGGLVGRGIGWGIEALSDSAELGADAGEAASDARTPIGSRRSPMDVAPGTNKPTVINGREYSGHALDRMQGRGLMPSVVEDTIATGSRSAGNTPGTTVFTSGQARVVVNATGKVVSVNPK